MSFMAIPGRGGVTPLVREKAITGTWEAGSLLTVNGSDQFAEAGADPATVNAVALHAVGSGSGAQYPVGRKEFPPNRAQACWSGHEFGFTADYTGTLPANAGANYGVVKDSDSKWKVDFSETVNTRLTLTDISFTVAPLSQRRVRIKFLTANVGPL